jgi:hypothetical protein
MKTKINSNPNAPRVAVAREIEQDQTSLQPGAKMVEITACRLLLVNLLGPLAKVDDSFFLLMQFRGCFCGFGRCPPVAPRA